MARSGTPCDRRASAGDPPAAATCCTNDRTISLAAASFEFAGVERTAMRAISAGTPSSFVSRSNSRCKSSGNGAPRTRSSLDAALLCYRIDSNVPNRPRRRFADDSELLLLLADGEASNDWAIAFLRRARSNRLPKDVFLRRLPSPWPLETIGSVALRSVLWTSSLLVLCSIGFPRSAAILDAIVLRGAIDPKSVGS